ncbi:MAG: hypothetical protein ACJAXB_002200 [Candidatus Endobugula sp.]|jgi:hypothetical protein
MISIEKVALSFGFDTDILQIRLDSIKKEYVRRKEEYEQDLSESEGNEVINDIRSQSVSLARNLSALPWYIKSNFNLHSVKRTIKDPHGIESDICISYGDDFIDDMIQRLKAISKVAKLSRLNTINQRKKIHRNWLLKDLRDLWLDLTGSSPSRSSGKNLFIDFIELSCEYMEVESKGLKRKHLNIK